MAGYGNADDHVQAQLNHAQDSLELHKARSRMINTNDTGLCLECGEEIPATRLQAVPRAAYCVACQEWHDRKGNLYNKFQIKNHYMP